MAVEYIGYQDQQGDFRVGDLFKIEQATGSATLNADALTFRIK